MKKTFINFLMIKLMLLTSAPTYGSANEALMQVTATVEPSCTVTASNLNFGPYNLAMSNETATIALLCTNGTKFRINLGAGNSGSVADNNRNMVSKDKLLKYSLYQDVTMKKPWGSDSSSLSGTGSGKLQYFKVYGHIPENQRLPSALYTDNVLISIIIDGVSGFGYQLSVGMTVASFVEP